MENKILSIVVPVYNVEKYLGKCLQSLVDQKMSNYEILVVNDGSTDQSQKVIDEFVDKYPEKVKGLVKENGGLSDARNFGKKYAAGKYLAFIDSDDYVNDTYFPVMVDMAEKDQLDLVVCDMVYIWEDGSKEPFVKDGVTWDATNDLVRAMFISPLSMCNKLFRRDLFESLNLNFYKGLWYEDIPVDLMYVANCNKIAYCESSKYNYVQRDHSILNRGFDQRMYHIFTIFDKVLEAFREKNLFEKYHDELEYLLVEHFLVYGAFRFLRVDDSHYKDLMKKAFAYVKGIFPNYLKNPYIHTLGKKNNIFLRTNNRLTMGFWHWYLTK